MSEEFLKRATALHRAGKLAEAALYYQQALAQDPEAVQTLHILGVLFTQMKDYDHAMDYLKRAAWLAPASSDIANSLGMALYPAGKAEEAISSFERALALDDQNAKAANNLGNVFFSQKNLEPARAAFERAVKIDAKHAEAHSNLGHCLLIADKPDAAIEQFEIALKLNPGFRHALEGLANAYNLLEQPDDVAAQRRRLVELAPKSPARWVDLGVSLQAIEQHDEAVRCFQKALEFNPQFAVALAQLGKAQMEMGQLEAARDSVLAACRLDPDSCYNRYLLFRTGKVKGDDQSLEHLKQLLARARDIPAAEQVFLHFALGKAFSDLGDNEQSFRHYLEGNRINREQVKYDEPTVLGQVDDAGKVLTPEILRLCAGAGNLSASPVFVLGMPRTGSTLLEQMLAAHPAVQTIGESPAFREIVLARGKWKGASFPDWVSSITREDVSSMGDEYVSRAQRTLMIHGHSAAWNDNLRVIDKMPGNFLFLGLIHLALPNAKFIHTRRDPIETCLSCFRIHFDTLRYSSDLGELGRYYRHYERLMSVWRTLLPPGSILDVDYEELVEDFEKTSRKIVAYCGLEWDDACLDFRSAERPVRTASAAQVRNPLYRSSLRTSRPSDALLKPLIDALNLTTDTGASLDS